MKIKTPHPVFRLSALPSIPAIIIAGLSLSACSMAPEYHQPAMAIPTHYKEALPPNWKLAQPADNAARGDWWKQFNDPLLDQLMTELASANQNLAMALASWKQATALSQQARSSLFPSLTAQASSTRSGGNANTAGVSNATQVGATLGWELDVWGHVREQVASQNATAQASLANYANTRLSLQAELANDYFALRVAAAQHDLLKASVADYADSLQLTRNRYAAGVATKADVSQAETQWLTANTQLEDNEITRAQLEHAIAVLVGKPAADFSLGQEADQLGTKMLAIELPIIPVELPASLLERRPDIAAAERQVAAANASIGVARAALFPQINLSANGGYRGSSLSGLFDIAHQFWSLGPSLALTLFDAGARQAAVNQSKAGFDLASASYKQTVLTALQGVEDQLVALRVLEREAQLQSQTVRSATETLTLTNNQYRSGIVPYLNVLTAQQTLQNARSNQINIRGRQLSATVQLLKALGGGWEGLGVDTASIVQM